MFSVFNIFIFFVLLGVYEDDLQVGQLINVLCLLFS